MQLDLALAALRSHTRRMQQARQIATMVIDGQPVLLVSMDRRSSEDLSQRILDCIASEVDRFGVCQAPGPPESRRPDGVV